MKWNPIAEVASKVNADPVHLHVFTLSGEKETLITSVFLQGTRHPDNVPVKFLLTFHVWGQVCVCYRTSPKGTCFTIHCGPATVVGSAGGRMSTILACLKRSQAQDVMDAAPYCCVCCEALAGTDKSGCAYFARESARLVL